MWVANTHINNQNTAALTTSAVARQRRLFKYARRLHGVRENVYGILDMFLANADFFHIFGMGHHENLFY